MSGPTSPPAGPGLVLTEVFTTLQGEGPATGRQATFVRFGGCNLSCSWCDSAFTWDSTRFNLREQIFRMSVDDVLDVCTADIAVLTGGEPLLHQYTEDWARLLSELTRKGVEIHLETNGTIAPNLTTQTNLDLASVSPKLDHASAGARTGVNPHNPEVLQKWAELARDGRAFAKYVVQTQEDCDTAVDQALAAGFRPKDIWLMPEGDNAALITERWPMVAQMALDHGVNATHRLHVLAWGSERGH